jgi:hypothetical protein
VVTVIVALAPEDPGVTVLGEMLQVAPAGAPLQASVTEELKPPGSGATLRVSVAEPPGFTVRAFEVGAGGAKSCATVMFWAADELPANPVPLKEAVKECDPAARLAMVKAAAPLLTLAVPKTVEPSLKVTVPAGVTVAETVALSVSLPPAVGLADKASVVLLAASGMVTVAFPVL